MAYDHPSLIGERKGKHRATARLIGQAYRNVGCSTVYCPFSGYFRISQCPAAARARTIAIVLGRPCPVRLACSPSARLVEFKKFSGGVVRRLFGSSRLLEARDFGL